jgi:hypothetical protein
MPYAGQAGQTACTICAEKLLQMVWLLWKGQCLFVHLWLLNGFDKRAACWLQGNWNNVLR